MQNWPDIVFWMLAAMGIATVARWRHSVVPRGWLVVVATILALALVGHLAAWNYFQSVKDKGNEEFIAKWKAFTKNPKRVTNDPMEAHVIGFIMWVKAVE